MEKIDKIVMTAITAVLALTAGTVMTTAVYAAPVTTSQPEMEKCYGIAKAQMNDCKTDHTSCAGSTTKDSQPDGFLLVPQGLCNKIVGGNLKPQNLPEKK